MIPFSIIVAIDSENGIGKHGSLPWHLPGELKHFKEVTTSTDSKSKKNAVIMGRKTWESIPEAYRPLHDRINIVLTRNPDLKLPEEVIVAGGLSEALSGLESGVQEGRIGSVYVIGGHQVFEEAIEYAQCKRILITHILQKFDCDTFFPEFLSKFSQSDVTPECQEQSLTYYFAEYTRK